MFSVLIKSLYFLYLISLLVKMVNYEDDKTYNKIVNNENIDGMYFRDMNIQIY